LGEGIHKIRGLLTILETLTTILHELVSKIVKLKESTSTWVEFRIVLSFLYKKGLTRKLKSNLLTMLILMLLDAFTFLLPSWWMASWLEWWEIVALGCCSHPSSVCKLDDGFCSMCPSMFVVLCILACLWFDLEFMSCYGGGCANLEWKLKKCTFIESF
jgi:hypothetical protein